MQFYAISIIGLSKNAGKTTLLNYLVQKNLNKSTKMGLISIGVDGEIEDALGGHAKPSITIPEGTLVATTQHGLKAGTAKWRILEKLNISSSLGDVYIAEAVQSGSVKLLGTQTIDNVSNVFKSFEKYGADELLVDGAYDRLSSANPILTNGTYIVIGASLDQKETFFWKKVIEKLRAFFFPVVKEEEVISMAKGWEEDPRIIIKQDNKWSSLPVDNMIISDSYLHKDIEWLIIPGVLTERMLIKMLKQKKAWHIVLQHGLKSFVSTDIVDRWIKKGGTIQVIHPIKIKGIAYNPYSPEGYSFSSKKMEENLRKVVQIWTNQEIPIFDVWRDGIKED